MPRNRENKQYRMRELDQKFKVRFSYQNDEGVSFVEAPLPDQFGFSVGSEFTASFDSSALAGVLQKLKLPFAGAVSRRVGVVTTKFYANPEPTEISFDVEFHAEYSARDEVVIPAVTLAMMALGRNLTPGELQENISQIGSLGRDAFNAIANFVPGIDAQEESEVDSGGQAEKLLTTLTEDHEETTGKALAFVGLIQGPPIVSIRFGNVYALDRVWVSSVTPTFSNVLDAEGLPLSATCSVTCTLQRDPVTDDVQRYFGFEGA